MFTLNKKPTDYKSLFFGDYGNVARIDIGGDPLFKKLAETSEANTWFLNVINCTNDRWTEMQDKSLSKFRKNIAYQTAMDSLVPSIFAVLSEVVTDPWLSYLYSRINTEENIHAMSYSSGISQAYGAKAEEFLDIIYTDSHINTRVDAEIDIATRFIKVAEDFKYSEDTCKLILETLWKTLYLEGVKFPFSFFTSWTVNKAEFNKAQGFSQLLILIAYDEMTVHTTTGSSLIKKLSKDYRFKPLFDSGWFTQMVLDYAKSATQAELNWADYLLEDGEIAGFTKPICEHFIKYWTDRRLSEIKQPTLYKSKSNDIISWFNTYRDPNSKSAALQEIDNTSYQLGQLRNDLYLFDKEN